MQVLLYADQVHGEDRAGEFRRFLSGHTPVQELIAVFKTENPQLVCIRAGIQQNTFFCQSFSANTPTIVLDHFDWLKKSDRTVGSSFSHYWTLGNQSIFLAEKPTAFQIIPAFPPETNTAVLVGASAYRLLDSALVLGVNHARAGSFVWSPNGETFAAELRPEFRPNDRLRRVIGSIETNHTGDVVKLEYKAGSDTNKYVVVYSYSQSINAKLPDSATRFKVSASFQNKVFVGKTEYFKFTVGVDGAVSENGYVPSLFLGNKSFTSVIINSNKVDYSLSPDGTLKQINLETGHINGDQLGDAITTSLISFAGLTLFALMWWYNSWRKTQDMSKLKLNK